MVVADPAVLVNTARYCVPDMAVVVVATVNVVAVAPPTLANAVDPDGADCHCTDGTGVPDAAALNDAD